MKKFIGAVLIGLCLLLPNKISAAGYLEIEQWDIKFAIPDEITDIKYSLKHHLEPLNGIKSDLIIDSIFYNGKEYKSYANYAFQLGSNKYVSAGILLRTGLKSDTKNCIRLGYLYYCSLIDCDNGSFTKDDKNACNAVEKMFLQPISTSENAEDKITDTSIPNGYPEIPPELIAVDSPDYLYIIEWGIRYKIPDEISGVKYKIIDGGIACFTAYPKNEVVPPYFYQEFDNSEGLPCVLADVSRDKNAANPYGEKRTPTENDPKLGDYYYSIRNEQGGVCTIFGGQDSNKNTFVTTFLFQMLRNPELIADNNPPKSANPSKTSELPTSGAKENTILIGILGLTMIGFSVSLIRPRKK